MLALTLATVGLVPSTAPLAWRSPAATLPRRSPAATLPRHSVLSAGLLSGDQPEVVQIVLTDRETDALVKALGKYPPEGPQWDSFSLTGATAENWETVRAEFPVLAARSDEELAGALRTYLNKGPDLFGVLTQTPVGPVILINILLYVTGVTWCDTPLGTAAACAQVAARKAAGE